MAPRPRAKKDPEILFDDSAHNGIAQQVPYALEGTPTPAITTFNKSATLSLELYDPSNPERKTLVERKMVFQRRSGRGLAIRGPRGPRGVRKTSACSQNGC